METLPFHQTNEKTMQEQLHVNYILSNISDGCDIITAENKEHGTEKDVAGKREETEGWGQA
jgi:hypothetical protein